MQNVGVTGVVIVVVAVAATGIGVAFEPSLDVVHEYDDHSNTLVGVEYDDQFDVLYSLDEGGGFVAYPVQDGTPSEITEFEAGHALTVGDGVVYVAAADTLWEYDVEAGELTELTTLEAHPQAIEYDEEYDVIWVGGDTTVYGYTAENGSEFLTYTEHTDGIADVHANGGYVATGSTWSDEAVVYDVEDESVVFEPDLPDDVGQVGAVHVTDDEELVVGTGADDGDVVAMFDIGEEEQLASYREHLFSVAAVEYDEANDVVVSMGFDNTVKFYDVNADEVAAVYEHADTIYAGDLDTHNGVLWFGDGEERVGTVTGIDVSYEEPTPAETASSTPDATADPEPDGTPTATAADGPGFTAVLTAVALLGLGSLAIRRRR